MSDETLSKYERENLLIKLEKEFAFAGAIIPSEIESGGERIPLRAFVFGMSKKRGRLTPEDTAEVDRVISIIRRRRRELVERLSREELTKAGAHELYAQARGLDRALDTLYSAPMPKLSLKEESRKAKMEDGRRWLNLVRKVYTGSDKRKRD
jgi:hypothetical protein